MTWVIAASVGTARGIPPGQRGPPGDYRILGVERLLSATTSIIAELPGPASATEPSAVNTVAGS